MPPRHMRTRTGLDIAVRPPVQSDEHYVIKSAVKTIRWGPAYRRMPPEQFFDTLGEQFRDLWLADSPVRLIACLPDDEDFIVGFICGDPGIPRLDYVHVRSAFAAQGIATALLGLLGFRQDSPSLITFETRDFVSRRSWPLMRVAGR